MIQSGSSALNVTVRLFASYKEKAGTAELRVALPERSAVSDLAIEVLRLHPSLISDVTRLVVAVNEEYQEHSHELREGDEVALIPPVSGGCWGEDMPGLGGVTDLDRQEMDRRAQ